MTDRVEIRDGREFRVTVLPEVKPKRYRKGMRTKAAARGIAIAKQRGAAAPKLTKCSGCKRPFPPKLIRRWRRKGKIRLGYCGECVRSYDEGRLLDREFEAKTR